MKALELAKEKLKIAKGWVRHSPKLTELNIEKAENLLDQAEADYKELEEVVEKIKNGMEVACAPFELDYALKVQKPENKIQLHKDLLIELMEVYKKIKK